MQGGGSGRLSSGRCLCLATVAAAVGKRFWPPHRSVRLGFAGAAFGKRRGPSGALCPPSGSASVFFVLFRASFRAALAGLWAFRGWAFRRPAGGRIGLDGRAWSPWPLGAVSRTLGNTFRRPGGALGLQVQRVQHRPVRLGLRPERLPPQAAWALDGPPFLPASLTPFGQTSSAAAAAAVAPSAPGLSSIASPGPASSGPAAPPSQSGSALSKAALRGSSPRRRRARPRQRRPRCRTRLLGEEGPCEAEARFCVAL